MKKILNRLHRCYIIGLVGVLMAMLFITMPLWFLPIYILSGFTPNEIIGGCIDYIINKIN